MLLAPYLVVLSLDLELPPAYGFAIGSAPASYRDA